MNKNIKLVLLLFVFVILLGGAYILYSKLSEMQTPDQLYAQETQDRHDDSRENNASATEETDRQETKAPDFTVFDAEGNEVSLSDYIGKPIVLNFWASWCGPCQSEMPDFHEKYLEIGEEVHFLMVNMTSGRETLEGAKKFILDKEYTFPVFYDTRSDAAVTYSVYSLPTTYFIDAEGFLIAQATGAIDAETLQRGIDMIQ